jgi:hypothetical protein
MKIIYNKNNTIENIDKYVFSFIWKITQRRVSDHLKLFESFVMSYVSQVQTTIVICVNFFNKFCHF